MLVDIDMCASQYDTRIWVWDESLDWPLACNDDYYFTEECGIYRSFIGGAPLAGGVVHYIIIDGYGGDCCQCEIDFRESEVCDLFCSPWPDCEKVLRQERLPLFGLESRRPACGRGTG